MQFVINISKTHARIFSAFLFILIAGIVSDYAFSAGLAQWHPLSELSADGGATSIATVSGKINASFIEGLQTSPWTANGSNIYNMNAGNVGIGTTAPGQKLDVNGTVQATAFLYSSDERLKDNIWAIDNPLEKILKLNGVSFNWKNSGDKGIGLVAQDMENVFPELVKTDSVSGMKSVEYGNLVAPLIEAIKEQQKMIENQQKEIEALKALIK